MSLRKLKTKHWLEQRILKPKQELMTKPYDNTSVVGQILSIAFKVIIFGIFGFMIIFPFYFMITQSLVDIQWQSKPDVLILFPRKFNELTDAFNWTNYASAFKKGYFQALLFTAGITTLSVLMRLFFSMTFGYAFAMRRWRGKAAFWGLFLSLMVLPEIALLSGQYTVISKLGITTPDLYWISLTIPFATSVFFGYMYKNAFEAIPDSVKESAMLDGASTIKYFFKIAVPMVKSTTWTVAILTAFASWNSYTWPLLVIGNNSASEWQVMNLWVFSTGRDETDPGNTIVYTSIRMAGTILAILPLVIVYFVLRKRIMNAIARNGKASKG